MKKVMLVLAAAILTVSLCGCSFVEKILPGHETDPVQTTAEEPRSTEAETETDPELPVVEGDVVIYGNRLTGLNEEEIAAALTGYLEKYMLTVTLDDTVFTLTAPDLGIFLNPDLDPAEVVMKLNSGEMTQETLQADIFTFESEEFVKNSMLAGYKNRLLELVDANVGETGTGELSEEEIKAVQKKIDGIVSPTSAKIVYREDEYRFVGVDGRKGETNDYTAAGKQVYEASLAFAPDVTAQSEVIYSDGEIAAESEEIRSALRKANQYLEMRIVYHFNPPDGEAQTLTMGRKTIGSWLAVDETGRNIYIDTDVVKQYAYSTAKRYDTIVKTETRERDGDKVIVTITSKGYRPHDDEIYADIESCLREKRSGEFTAKYYRLNKKHVMTEDEETYVYIDLTKQKAYLYVNGEVDYSTSIVSGNVAEGHRTPTGTYYIFSKDTERYLTGATYRSYVHYFMPFNGGIGMHDADGWRSSYGGSIYLRDGSHGCINMPYKAAKYFFKHVELGTKVIVVGGARTVDDRTQDLKVTPTSITLNPGETKKLSCSAKGSTKYRYESDDPDVCTVSEDGLITAVGKGTAKVTVRVSAKGYVDDAEHVTVRVNKSEQVLTTKDTDIKMAAGTERQLTVKALGDPVLKFKSSDPTVCKVAADGTVTAKKAGKATVTVTASATDQYMAGTLTIHIEVTPKETRPTKPAETTPAETQPAETTPEETLPPETTPEETLPPETTPKETPEETPGEKKSLFDWLTPVR